MTGEFDQFKFLSTDERALLEQSAANDDTVEELVSRMKTHREDGDQTMNYRRTGYSQPRRSPQAGYDPNEPHTDYPRTGQNAVLKLDASATDYDETVEVLKSALTAAEESFAAAFTRADERAAIRRRIDGAANPQTIAKATERRTRIG